MDHLDFRKHIVRKGKHHTKCIQPLQPRHVNFNPNLSHTSTRFPKPCINWNVLYQVELGVPTATHKNSVRRKRPQNATTFRVTASRILKNKFKIKATTKCGLLLCLIRKPCYAHAPYTWWLTCGMFEVLSETFET